MSNSIQVFLSLALPLKKGRGKSLTGNFVTLNYRVLNLFPFILICLKLLESI